MNVNTNMTTFSKGAEQCGIELNMTTFSMGAEQCGIEFDNPNEFMLSMGSLLQITCRYRSGAGSMVPYLEIIVLIERQHTYYIIFFLYQYLPSTE